MTNATGLHFYWVLIFIMPLCIKKPFRSFIEIAFASWMGLKPSFIDPFSTDYLSQKKFLSVSLVCNVSESMY